MGYRIFIVRTDVNASDRTRGFTDTEIESALKVDSGKKIPCRTGKSNLRQRRDSPMHALLAVTKEEVKSNRLQTGHKALF